MTSECLCALGLERKGVGSDGENPSQPLSLLGVPTLFFFRPQPPKATEAMDFLFLYLF